MPHFDVLPDRALEDILPQIAVRLDQLVGPRLSPDTEFTLKESFSVWNLSDDRLREVDATRLDQLATDADTWHHQVAANGQRRLFARSRPEGAAGLHVFEVAHSGIASNLHRTIIWIDANVVDVDYRVRLLVAPEYLLHAFWLTKGPDSQVVLADVCKAGQLVVNRRYPEAEFLTELRAMDPIVGISL